MAEATFLGFSEREIHTKEHNNEKTEEEKGIKRGMPDDNREKSDEEELDNQTKSPESKKNKVETRKNDGQKNKEEERERWDHAKKTLISNMNDENVKKIIECLDLDQIGVGGAESSKKNLRKCMQAWRNKDDSIREAITVLNWRDVRFMGRIERMDGEKLLNCLIVSILKRMPRKCEECNGWFSELDESISQDSPKLRCFICNRGSHGCGMNTVKNWMCVCCKSVIVEYEENMFERMREIALEGRIQTINKMSELDKEEEKNMERNMDEDDERSPSEERGGVEPTGGTEEEGRRSENETRQMETGDADGNRENEVNDDNVVDREEDRGRPEGRGTRGTEGMGPGDRDSGDTSRGGGGMGRMDRDGQGRREECWWWNTKTCRYGTRCRYLHLERCKKVLDTGFCWEVGAGMCKLKHPKVCRERANNRPCNREDCRYIHPERNIFRSINEEYSRRRDSSVENGLLRNSRGGGDELPPFLWNARTRGSLPGAGMGMRMGSQGQRDRMERMGGAWGAGGTRGEDGGMEVGRTSEMIERLKTKMNERMNERLRVAMEEYNREMIEEVEKEMRRKQNS